MHYKKMTIIKMLCTIGVVMGTTFSAHAMQQKTYSKKSTSKTLTTLSPKKRSPKKPIAFTEISAHYKPKKLVIEPSKQEIAKAKRQQNKENELKKINKQAEIVCEVRKKEIALAEDTDLKVQICSDKYLSRQKWLHNEFLDREYNKEARERTQKELAEKEAARKDLSLLASMADGQEYILEDDQPNINNNNNNNNNQKTRKIRTVSTVPMKDRVIQQATNENLSPYKSFLLFINKKQTGLVLDAIADEQFRNKYPLAKRLYDVQMNEYHGTTKYVTNSLPQSSLDYVAVSIAKKADPINTQCIQNYLKDFAIKSVKKEKKYSDEIVGKKPQCFGWEFNCKDGEKCQHSVDVNGQQYKRFFKVSLPGDSILKEQTPFTRSVLKSARAHKALSQFQHESSEYSDYKESLLSAENDSSLENKVKQQWMIDRNKLTNKWFAEHKKLDYTQLGQVYGDAGIKKDSKYSVSIIIPTEESLSKKPALTSLVSVARQDKNVDEFSYGHSPFTQLQ